MTVNYFRPTSLALPLIGLSIALSPVGSSAANAAEVSLYSKLSVSFLGIPVGKMKSSIQVSDSAYRISGSVKTSGVVKIVSKTVANFASSGVIAGNKAIPVGHKLKYASNKKRGDLSISFAAGNIHKVSSTPKVKYKPGSIPVEKSHLKSVLDPVSSLLFPVKVSQVGNGRAVCNRTLPVFDGKSRMNLKFTYKSSNTRKVEGFKGKTFTCAVRYLPVAGIRPNKENIKFMKANRDMEVTMARIGESNVYSLFAFSVRTDKGTATGEAYTFSVN